MHAAGASLPAAEQGFVFLALLAAFAIKMPLVPFHGWQPEAYFAATTEGRMLMSALLAKLGIFGVIRWLVPLSPAGVADFGDVVVIVAVGGALYASLLALMQTNLVRMIAYASVAHVDLIAAGVFASAVAHGGQLEGTSGLFGAVLQMLSHGVTSIGLFFIAHMIEHRVGSTELDQARALRERLPSFGWLSLLIVLGSIAVPLTSGFWGELLLLLGLYEHAPALAALGTLSMVFGAVYMLRAYQRLMLGAVPAGAPPLLPLSRRDLAVLGSVAACIILFGLFPRLVLGPFLGTADIALR
jgi:NADH-quinone oxidoreductase subunit M